MKALLIDLDCTLYPMESALYLTMGIRITDYMQAVLGMTRTEAIIKRDAYWKEYGLTLIGLIRHHDISAEDFLHYVHNVNIKKNIHPNPELAQKLMQIPVKKILFTNSCRYYAGKVLSVLGMQKCFGNNLFDIRDMDFFPKPHPKAYEIVLHQFQLSGDQCVMIDDSLDNLRSALSFGMKTIWVGKGKCPADINGHAVVPNEIIDQVKRFIG